jgi:NAD(P)H-hydrate epimerase
MVPVITAAEMRELDRATIDEVGLPGIALMETAGRAVAAAAARMIAEPGRAGPVAVVCGPGNNGGDGFAAARVLRAQGVDAVAYLAAPRAVVAGHAAAHLAILERSGGVVLDIADSAALLEHRSAIAGSALVVDALLGVGLVRPIAGHLAAVVDVMRAARRVLAVDLPSGLETDTGAALGAVVPAERTVTIAALKVALASAPGFALCGEVEIADIGVPPALLMAIARAGVIERADVARALPRPGPLDHKGSRGHTLVVGGAPGMRGAGRLAALGAARAGSGLVTLASPAEADEAAPDVVMTRGLAAAGEGAVHALRDAAVGKAAIAIGPGLGRSAAMRALVDEVLTLEIPVVIDADALAVLGAGAAALAGAAGPVVITPHPGEAARLLATGVAEIERDRLGAARALAAQTRAVVVLKGARTVVCDGTLGDEYCAIAPTGGPALATGGSGDVLAGVIGALLAQGVPAAHAARAGAFVHGAAGDAVGAALGRGTLASDLPAAVAAAIRDLTAAHAA